MKQITVAVLGTGWGWYITSGWALFSGPYSHAAHGSVVKKSFAGPFHYRRAHAWIKTQVAAEAGPPLKRPS